MKTDSRNVKSCNEKNHKPQRIVNDAIRANNSSRNRGKQSMFINIYTKFVTTIELNVTCPLHIEIDFGGAHKKPTVQTGLCEIILQPNGS